MTYVELIADSPVQLWGLGSRERLGRQVAQIEGLRLAAPGEAVPADAPRLLVRADFLFELRTLKALLKRPGTLLVTAGTRHAAAAHVVADQVAAGRAALTQPAAPTGLATVTPAELEGFDAYLRRAEPPLLEPVDESRRAALEALLYGNSYKGITDLVTKWVWPRPARVGVRVCTWLGITPNMVTSFGALLMFTAAWLFATGHYVAGLCAGWFMTYLDTVDGKLARVTIRSSRFGHALDHGMDILHPPFWYILWGLSLENMPPILGIDEATGWNLIIVFGYVAGRAVEGIFEKLLGCELFSWRPQDSWFRLITARRNPVLILLTLSVLFGRPDIGYVAAALWTALCSAWQGVRLVAGLVTRSRRGPLVSWLADPAAAEREHPRSFATFSGTRGAYRVG